MFQKIDNIAKHLKLGISLKKSKFLTKNRFFSAVLKASQCCEYVFVDYEGASELLSPSDVNDLLKMLDNKLVLTIAVRGTEFHRRKDLLAAYLQLAREWNHVQFCFVPGHLAYESVDKSIPLEQNLHRFIEATRDVTSSEVFFGIENVPFSTMREVMHRHDGVIPFVLNGDHRLSRMGEKFDNLALYSPATFRQNLQVSAGKMQGYLLRRKWTWQLLEKNGIDVADITSQPWSELPQEVKKVLLLALDHFVLTRFNFEHRLLEFLQHGIKYLVLHPIALDDVLFLKK